MRTWTLSGCYDLCEGPFLPKEDELDLVSELSDKPIIEDACKRKEQVISLDKTYRTRDGRQVRLYTVDASCENEDFENVHGAVLQTASDGEPRKWQIQSWFANGAVWTEEERDTDLVEARPQRTGWINIYDDSIVHPSFEEASKASGSYQNRPTIARIQITFTEGEGL